MNVTKMHGACNDFVIIDTRTTRLDDVSTFARWACRRRTGIGADGCIVLEPSAIADVRMRTVNADGSEAEMCGNGVRCAARWLDDAGEGDRVAFETDAGIVRTEIVGRDPEYLVRVAMGRPRFAAIPGLGPMDGFVEIGNPHVVLLRDDLDALDLQAVAEALQEDPRFTGGTNVHVAAKLSENALRVRHWERGVGPTLACGTGAVAVAAVAIKRAIAESPVQLFVPGGHLIVEWDGSGDAYLTGPAVRVFDAELGNLGLGVHSLR